MYWIIWLKGERIKISDPELFKKIMPGGNDPIREDEAYELCRKAGLVGNVQKNAGGRKARQ